MDFSCCWVSGCSSHLAKLSFYNQIPLLLMKIYTYFPAFILHGDIPQLLRKHLIFTEDNNRQYPSPTFLLLCMSRTWLISQDLGNTVFLLLYLSDSVRPGSNPVSWCNISVHAKFPHSYRSLQPGNLPLSLSPLYTLCSTCPCDGCMDSQIVFKHSSF